MILDFDTEHSVVLSLLNEALERAGTIGGCRFDTQTDGQRSHYGAFSTAIVSDNEVDQRAQLDSKFRMTHEVLAIDFLDDTAFRWLIFFLCTQLLENA